jgi:MFS family permease
MFISGVALFIGIGMGIATPASANAALDLMPQRASTIQGVRGMFRQSGGAISIAMTTLVLQFVGNLALGFKFVFISTGLIVLLTIPFIFAMPDRDARALAEDK